MGDKTGIAWTDSTWNPTRGCTRVSSGCTRCYAERVAARFDGPGNPYEGTIRRTKSGPRWNGHVKLVPEKLDQPLRWRRPRLIFVNSMSDLFHESIPFEYVAAVFGVMAASTRHTFQCLTKRPERMLMFFEWLRGEAWPETTPEGYYNVLVSHAGREASDGTMEGHMTRCRDLHSRCQSRAWPLPNVWLGVSAENQETADARIPLLLQAPAAVHFVSAEPLLGPISFTAWPELSWVIAGGESGPGARPCDATWTRRIIRQCTDMSVPVFVKQLGKEAYDSDYGSHGAVLGLKDKKGGDWDEWPHGLRVRQWPHGVEVSQ